MKKIGLMGGLGPASTVDYYLGLIEKTRSNYGEDIYPEIVIDSVDMNEHMEAFESSNYEKIGKLILESLENLKNAGARVGAITANTEHIVWERIHRRFPLPVISIIDATVDEIKRCGYKRVLVFGTEFTLRSGLYKNSLLQNGITAIIPSDDDITLLGSLIYPNLENGIVIEEDRQKMIAMAEKYIREQKADAMILGCTEIPLAIKPGDVSVATINTTEIHINAIFEAAREE